MITPSCSHRITRSVAKSDTMPTGIEPIYGSSIYSRTDSAASLGRNHQSAKSTTTGRWSLQLPNAQGTSTDLACTPFTKTWSNVASGNPSVASQMIRSVADNGACAPAKSGILEHLQGPLVLEMPLAGVRVEIARDQHNQSPGTIALRCLRPDVVD